MSHVVLSLDEVRSLPRLPSGYITDREFRLEREKRGNDIIWSLREHRLRRPIEKIYDDGTAATWVESHEDAGPPEGLRFLGASVGGAVEGLATWTVSDWNRSLWLIDLRVRKRHRRTGIGTSLVEGLVDLSRSHDLRGIFVETQTRNYPAVRFYIERGFRVSGFNDRLYTNEDFAENEIALFLFREVRKGD